MDLKRLISGILVAPAVAILLLIPNTYIVGFLIAIITVYAMNEYLNAISKVCKPVKWIGYLSCLIVATINFIPKEVLLQVMLLTIPTITTILFLQVIITDMKTTVKDIAYTLFGICYISIFMMFIPLIDNMENGKFLIGYVLIAGWGNDIFAYSIGKRFGKHKFSKVSPKKSIEGCVAGSIGAVILMLIYTMIINKLFGFNYSYIFVTVIGIILSIIGQIGDFSASTIKRYVEIKDYSNLLPGHGGMLDRIDSILFIVPYAYLMFLMI